MGVLFAVGNFGTFFFGIIMTMIARGESKLQTLAALGFCLVMFAVGLLAVWRLREEKNREDYEAQKKLEADSLSNISQEKTTEGIEDPLLSKD